MIHRIKKEIREGKTFITFTLLRTLGQGFMFIVPLFIARLLSPEEFGIYSLSIMIVYFFTALLINSSQKPFIVYANQELSESGTIQKAFTIRVILLGSSVVLFSLLALLFINPLSQFASITTTQFLFLFAAYIGMGIRYLFGITFLALNKRIEHTWYGIIVGLISILYVVGVYYFSTLTLESIFLMFLVAPLLTIPFVSKWIDFKKLFPLNFDRQLFGKMFDYTKWTMVGGAAVYFISWGDNLVLRYFVPLEEIGLYNLGYQIFKGVLVLAGVIWMYFLPFISQHLGETKKIQKYLYSKRPKIFFLGVISIVAIFFIVPYFFEAFYGDAYKESVNIIRVLLIAMIFVLHRDFYVPIFDAMKKYRFTQLANVSFVVVNILLNIVFVSRFGMVGAAYATVITYAFSSLVYEIYFRKRCKKKLLGV